MIHQVVSNDCVGRVPLLAACYFVHMCRAHSVQVHLGELSQYTHHVTHNPVMQARRLHTASQQDSSHSSTEARFRSGKIASQPGQFNFLGASEASKIDVSDYRERTGS